MDTLKDIGVDPKMYKNWFLLNQNTTVRVKTANGYTEWRKVGELLGQGSGGGAMASAANLDKGVDQYFRGSMDEIMYGCIRLQPLIFVDDVARVTTARDKAQAGNIKLDCLMNTKQLMLHPDKTCYLVLGKGDSYLKMENEIAVQPITCGEFEPKRKMQEKWLGDIFSSQGLDASVQATIEDRIPRVKAAMFEIKGIIEDFRSQCLGGVEGALDLWEFCVIPMALNSAGTWTDTSEKSINILENLQNMFVRLILHLPDSTPKPVLTFDTGLLSMRHRIMAAKLNLAYYFLFDCDGHLAGQVYSEQLRQGWPGLSREVAVYSEMLGVPNVNKLKIGEISPNMWKECVKKAIWKHNEAELKSKMENYKKLNEIKNESFERKEYLKSKSIVDSRMTIRLRSKMFHAKDNFKNKYINRKNGLSCESCNTGLIESQSHVLICTAYDKLREGLNLNQNNDIVKYYREVLLLRAKLEK